MSAAAPPLCSLGSLLNGRSGLRADVEGQPPFHSTDEAADDTRHDEIQERSHGVDFEGPVRDGHDDIGAPHEVLEEITDTSDESFNKAMNSLPSAGKIFRNAWGKTIRRMTLDGGRPIARPALAGRGRPTGSPARRFRLHRRPSSAEADDRTAIRRWDAEEEGQAHVDEEELHHERGAPEKGHVP